MLTGTVNELSRGGHPQIASCDTCLRLGATRFPMVPTERRMCQTPSTTRGGGLPVSLALVHVRHVPGFADERIHRCALCCASYSHHQFSRQGSQRSEPKRRQRLGRLPLGREPVCAVGDTRGVCSEPPPPPPPRQRVPPLLLARHSGMAAGMRSSDDGHGYNQRIPGISRRAGVSGEQVVLWVGRTRERDEHVENFLFHSAPGVSARFSAAL